MAASRQTIDRVYDLVKQYVPDDAARGRFIYGLIAIDGNASFRATATGLCRAHELDVGARHREKKEAPTDQDGSWTWRGPGPWGVGD